MKIEFCIAYLKVIFMIQFNIWLNVEYQGINVVYFNATGHLYLCQKYYILQNYVRLKLIVLTWTWTLKSHCSLTNIQSVFKGVSGNIDIV